MTKTSIIITILNEVKFIENCLNSIIKYNSLMEYSENIIIDGGFNL